jgi:sugar phosphate isomerase/epimerase
VVHSLLVGLGHSRPRGVLLHREELRRLVDLRSVSFAATMGVDCLPIPGGAMPGMPGGVPAKPGGRL